MRALRRQFLPTSVLGSDTAALCRFHGGILLLTMLMLLGLFASIFTGELMAQNYQSGYKKYTMGDMVGAERDLAKSLKLPMNNAEKSQTYKLLGIVEYGLGKRGPATAAFKGALAANPGIVIRPDEVLDTTVIEFFSKIKSSFHPVPVAKKTKPKPPAESKEKPKEKPSTEKPLVEKTPTSRPTDPKGGSTTRLSIKSNAPSAEVYIDGILVGTVSQDLDVSPGPNVVMLKAKGFKAKAFKMTLTKGKVNHYNLNLVKLVKAQPPEAKTGKNVAAGPGAVGAGAAVAGAPNKQAGKKGKGGGSGDLFSDKEPDYKPEGAASTTDPSVGLVATSGAPAVAAAPAAVPAGAPAAAVAQPPVSYVAQPPGGYVAQPPAGYVAQPPAGYVAQPPAGYVAQQPAQPVIVVTGNQTPAYPMPYGYPGAYGAPAQASPPPPDYYESQGDKAPPMHKNKKSKVGRKGGFSALSLLPFGIGQFANGSALKGSLFAAGQIGLLAYWYSNTQAADSGYSEASQVKSSGLYDGDTAARDAYLSQMDAYIKAKETTAMYGLIGFGVGWAAGIYDAIMNVPAPVSKKLADWHDVDENTDPTQTAQESDGSALTPQRHVSTSILPIGLGLIRLPADPNLHLAITLDYHF